MKRNYMQAITTHSAPITEGKLNLADLKAKLVACVTADIALREARAYVRAHCPTLTEAQKVDIDRFVMTTIAATFNLTLHKAKSNGVFSGLAFDRKQYPRAYNALEYFRLSLRGLGTGKDAEEAKAEKKHHRAEPKADAKRFAKAHDAGYLAAYIEALKAELAAMLK